MITSSSESSFKRCARLIAAGFSGVILNPTTTQQKLHLSRLSEMRKTLLLALPNASQDAIRILDNSLYILAEGGGLKAFSDVAALFHDDLMNTDKQGNIFFCVPSAECALINPKMSALAPLPLKYTNLRYNFENNKPPPQDLDLHLDIPNVLILNPKHSMASGEKGLSNDVILHELQHIADGIKIKKWIQDNLKLLRKSLSADPLFLNYVGYVSLSPGSPPIISIDQSFVMTLLELKAYSLSALNDLGQRRLVKTDLEKLNQIISKGQGVPFQAIVSNAYYGINPQFLVSENITQLNFWQRLTDFDNQMDKTIALAEHVSD